MNAEIIKELDKILPVVVRVHGDHHPELYQVAALYAAIRENKDVWNQLRDVTNHFTAPADACPTYEKTYRDLAMLDKEWA